MKRMLTGTRLALVIVAIILGTSQSGAQDNFVFWPDANYDPTIPTFESVLGYGPGEQITWHRDAIRYFEALAAAAPDRLLITRYATTWEGRELIYVAISSPPNIAQIDGIKAGMQRLADPRVTTRPEAQELIETQPAQLPGCRTVFTATRFHRRMRPC